MMGLPVIACEEGIIGWRTRKHQLGLSVAVDDLQAVVEAINRLARDRGLSDEFGRNGRRYSAGFSVDNFTRVVCDELHLV
jgi:glycosyltransferase involved in cell wall biosynthesis